MSKYPKEQVNIFYNKAFRDFLENCCSVDPKNNTKQYRIWDKDVQPTDTKDEWYIAMQRPHPEIPWILISNGKTGYEGKLPMTVSETESLIQEYIIK